jgi:hypothetical protein
MSIQQKMTRRVTACALAFSFAGLMGAATPATSKPNYDGLWSVVIVTQKGSCDRAYRYPIRISHGTVINEGSSPATITGKVASNGKVSVTVTAGNQSATGFGRLSGSAGRGSWQGGECSGVWEAERRGA